MDTVFQFRLRRESRTCGTNNLNHDTPGKGVHVAYYVETIQYQSAFCTKCGDYIDLVKYRDPSIRDTHFFIPSILCKCVSDHGNFTVFSEVHNKET